MFHLFVKKQYKNEIEKLLNNPRKFGVRVTILSPEHLKKLINLNCDLKKYCFKIPNAYKLGEYITCLDNIAYDLSDFSVNSRRIIKNGSTAWRKGRTFRIARLGAGGATLFDKEGQGLYINWVRPATEEEIKKEKEREEKEDDILNFW